MGWQRDFALNYSLTNKSSGNYSSNLKSWTKGATVQSQVGSLKTCRLDKLLRNISELTVF